MGLAVYPRASFAWEWKAFSEGGFAEGGLRGWLAFAACGAGFYFPKGAGWVHSRFLLSRRPCVVSCR